MNALELRRRTLGKSVYKKTVEGNPAIAQGSLARRYPGITMQGWTEQAQYEGKNLFDKTKIEDGIDTTHTQTDTGIEVSGLYYVKYRGSVAPNTDMCISYNKSGEGANQVSVYGTDLSQDNLISNSYGTGMEFNTGKHTEILVLFYCGAGTEKVSIYNDVMLNLGFTALPYEPYTGGQPSPSPDYPQEIVSAGKYNEDTQKWEYEITIANEQTDPDKNQTVTLTSDRPLTKWDKLEKRNGQWGWVYKSAEIVLDGSEQNVEGFALRNETVAVYYVEILEKQKGSDNVIIDKMRYEYGAWGGTTGEYTFSGHPVSKLIYLSIPVSEEGEGIKSWFTSNPLVLWCETAEETFVPLSASEQEQMNTLHTFRPTTVLSNDCECEMTLTYKTKKSLEVTT